MTTDQIPHVRLTVGEAEIEAVAAVLRSGYLASGPVGAKLEQELAHYITQTHCAAVSSGTTALHAALLALGVGRGDEVVVPAYVCQALLNAVNYVGATACVADINLDTFTLDPQGAAKHITDKTKALIVPHMFGLMADMSALQALNVPIIEDCAFGLGGRLNGRPAGSFGGISTFSFYATKMIAAGEGGAVASSNEKYIDTVRDIREYDKKKEYKVRYNYLLSDINATLALTQLRQIDSFIQKRQQLAAQYTEALRGNAFVLPKTPEGYEHAYTRYVIRADNSEKLRAHLLKRGVETGRGVVVGTHELLQTGEYYPASDEALRTAVSLPLYPTLTDAEQGKVIDALKSY